MQLDEVVLTVPEIARRLVMSQPSIMRAIENGFLPAFPVGTQRQMRVRLTDYEDWVAKGEDVSRGARGSSVLENDVDVLLEIAPHDGKTNERIQVGLPVAFRVKKNKDKPTGDRMLFAAESVYLGEPDPDDTDQDPVTSLVLVPYTEPEGYSDLLDEPPLSPPEGPFTKYQILAWGVLNKACAHASGGVRFGVWEKAVAQKGMVKRTLQSCRRVLVQAGWVAQTVVDNATFYTATRPGDEGVGMWEGEEND